MCTFSKYQIIFKTNPKIKCWEAHTNNFHFYKQTGKSSPKVNNWNGWDGESSNKIYYSFLFRFFFLIHPTLEMFFLNRSMMENSWLDFFPVSCCICSVDLSCPPLTYFFLFHCDIEIERGNQEHVIFFCAEKLYYFFLLFLYICVMNTIKIVWVKFFCLTVSEKIIYC